jgi:hypothetical protein
VRTVELGCVNIKPSSIVRSLGITTDDTLSFDEHVDSVSKTSSFNLRALRHIRQHISEATTKTIARSMTDGRLDYCNSVLYRTSMANINELQRVQNPPHSL